MVWRVRELSRYPVKSMAGTPLQSAFIGWHGIDGDRRFALRRMKDTSGFPWVSASSLPRLILYRPESPSEHNAALPTHVRTPDGVTLPIASAELQDELSAQLGQPLEVMALKHGMFDEAPISVIALQTIEALCREGGVETDTRRFRANIVLEGESGEPFVEDQWVGRTIRFGDTEHGPAVHVTMRDVRCMMLNLQPDTAKQDPGVMKAAVRLNDNNAGVYATVLRTGEVRVGDPVHLE